MVEKKEKKEKKISVTHYHTGLSISQRLSPKVAICNPGRAYGLINACWHTQTHTRTSTRIEYLERLGQNLTLIRHKH